MKRKHQKNRNFFLFDGSCGCQDEVGKAKQSGVQVEKWWWMGQSSTAKLLEFWSKQLGRNVLWILGKSVIPVTTWWNITSILQQCECLFGLEKTSLSLSSFDFFCTVCPQTSQHLWIPNNIIHLFVDSKPKGVMSFPWTWHEWQDHTYRGYSLPPDGHAYGRVFPRDPEGCLSWKELRRPSIFNPKKPDCLDGINKKIGEYCGYLALCGTLLWKFPGSKLREDRF